MRIITLNTLDDSKYKPLGLVRGTIVHSVSFFRDILGNITGLLGGRNSAINKKIDDVERKKKKDYFHIMQSEVITLIISTS